MTYGREDFSGRIKKAQEEQRVAVLERMRQVQGVGGVMSELQADPRWAIYGNHLAEIKQRYKQSQEAAERLLLDGKFMSNEQYGMTKIQQAEHRGTVRGIELALTLAKELIERGEQAAKIVANMVQKENI